MSSLISNMEFRKTDALDAEECVTGRYRWERALQRYAAVIKEDCMYSVRFELAFKKENVHGGEEEPEDETEDGRDSFVADEIYVARYMEKIPVQVRNLMSELEKEALHNIEGMELEKNVKNGFVSVAVHI